MTKKTNSESNKLARYNGKIIENKILEFCNIECLGHPVDSEMLINTSTGKQVPVEIKSCQKKITDVHNSNGARCGRLWFKEKQHQYLLQNNGYYIIAVHENGDVLHTALIKAEKMVFDNLPKCVSWKAIINGIL